MGSGLVASGGFPQAAKHSVKPNVKLANKKRFKTLGMAAVYGTELEIEGWARTGSARFGVGGQTNINGC